MAVKPSQARLGKIYAARTEERTGRNKQEHFYAVVDDHRGPVGDWIGFAHQCPCLIWIGRFFHGLFVAGVFGFGESILLILQI